MSTQNINLADFSKTILEACNINSAEQLYSTNGLLKSLEKAMI
jgi:hypothetical protein